MAAFRADELLGVRGEGLGLVDDMAGILQLDVHDAIRVPAEEVGRIDSSNRQFCGVRSGEPWATRRGRVV